MNIFNTFVISTVISFFQAFWSDPVGKVFLATTLTYSISYMLYSSYISWFAGGYGSILLGQMGFTTADFLALFPTSLLLFFIAIWYFIKAFIKYALIYLVIPFAFGYLIISVRIASGFMIPNQNSLPATVGILIYLVGFGLSSTSIKLIKDKPAIPIIISYAGAILAALTLFPASTTPSLNANPNAPSIVLIFLNEIIALMLVVYSVAAPSFIGLSLASFAVKGELLSKVSSLVLKQPIQIAGLSIQKSTGQKRTQDQVGNIFSYKTNSEKPVYLISSFSRVTALYLPPQTVDAEQGRMQLLTNDLIYSIEVEGRKKEDEDWNPL